MRHSKDKVALTSFVLLMTVNQFQMLSGKPMENGQSVVGKEGVIIDCRTQHDSYFPDPDDCRFFYHCSDWTGLERKSCGSLYFHHQKRVCDWPYIVRQIRPECPHERDLPNLEDSRGLGLKTTDSAPYDDGAYVRFEPDPQNKFRFPTPKPRPKVKNPVVFHESDFVSNTVRPSLTIQEKPDLKLVPFLPPSGPSRAQSPRRLPEPTFEQHEPFVLVKRKEAIAYEQPTTTTYRPVTIVKTLPTRTIVKSLPTPPPQLVVHENPTPTPATQSSSATPFLTRVQNARRPLFDPASRPNILRRDRNKARTTILTTTPPPVRSLPIHRISPSLRPNPIFSTERPKRNDQFCAGPRCYRPKEPKGRQPIKIKASHGDDIETIFQKVVVDKEDLADAKQRDQIKKLLEAAKVDPLYVEEEEETTTLTSNDKSNFNSLKVPLAERDSDYSYTTTPKPKVEIKSTQSPFKNAEDRPDFLEVIKKKAERLQEQLDEEELANITTEMPEDEDFHGSKVVVTVSKAVSSSIGTSLNLEPVYDPTTTELPLNEEVDDIDTTEATTSEATASTKSTPTTERIVETTISEIAEEVRELFEDPEEELLTIVEPSGFGNDLVESLGEFEETVIIVPSVQVEPTLDVVGPESGLDPEFIYEPIDGASNALQETRLHSTSVTTTTEEAVEEATDDYVEIVTEEADLVETSTMEAKADSVEILTSVIDVFNMTAIFEHLQNRPGQKPMAEKFQQTTTESLKTVSEEQSPQTEPKPDLVESTTTSTTASTTTTEVTTILPSVWPDTTTDSQTLEETTLIEEGTQDEGVTTQNPTTPETTESPPLSTRNPNVQVVLPAGYTAKDDSTPITLPSSLTTPIDVLPTTTEASTAQTVQFTTMDNTMSPTEASFEEATTTSSTTEVTTASSTTEVTTASSTIEPISAVREPSFTSRRDQIRRRFQSKPKPSKTHSILEQLKEQKEAASEAARRRKSFQSIEDSKSEEVASDEVISIPATTASNRDLISTTTPSHELQVDQDKLNSRRKQLFSRPRPSTTSTPGALSSSPLTAQDLDEESRRGSPLFNKQASSNPIWRSKSTNPEDSQPSTGDKDQPTTSARQSIRCRILKMAC